MATNTISKIASIVKENRPIHIAFTDNGTPAVLTSVVAEHFGKKHKSVLRDIAKLRPKCLTSFCEHNFVPTSIEVSQPNGGTRQERAYLLTRDGFTLLVMGFTGAAAVAWKLKYIEAFNSLEAAVLHNQTELAHQAGYQQGLDEARALPAAEAERKVAYLQGMKEGKKLQKRRDGLALTRKAVAYRKKGLSLRDTARLLGMPMRTLADLLVRARTLGVQA